MRRVVVTGIGVVSPIGTGVENFFNGLQIAQPGVDSIRSFDAQAFPTRIAGEVKDLSLDAVNLPATHRAALLRDRKSVFGIVAAREALDSAFGTTPLLRFHAPDRRAAFIAAGLEIFHLQDIIAHLHNDRINGQDLLAEVMHQELFSKLQIPADLGARCIAREAEIGGMCSVNLSACAAGTQALGEAFLSIRDGVADMAIAGGYDSMINPLGVGGFCMLEALSRSNHLGSAASRPFDARRDGFVLGEGSGMCVLESLDLARQRNARCLAEIVGYGSTLDAYRVADPAPDHMGAEAAMKKALADAKISPAQVGYISAHGTGTRKNDIAETQAIHRVFGSAAKGIPVSSTKSQTGHLIGAAGAMEFLAGLFALQKDCLPATINLTEPDPQCDLDYIPKFPRPARISYFLSNSFGFGGQNATIVAGRCQL